MEGFLIGFLHQKTKENKKTMILVKTSKKVIFLKENLDFQEIQDTEANKIQTKIDEKSHVFWDLDFGWILGRFWEGLGGQNP